MSYCYSSCCSCSCWDNISKKAQGSVVSNQIGMKYGKIVEVNTHRLTESSFWLWRLTFEMAAMSFHAKKCCHLVDAHAASARCVCSSVRQFHLYLFKIFSVDPVSRGPISCNKPLSFLVHGYENAAFSGQMFLGLNVQKRLVTKLRARKKILHTILPVSAVTSVSLNYSKTQQ